MQSSIKPSGYVVLMEPVLEDGDGPDEIDFKEKGQGMKIRKLNWYKSMFKRHQIVTYDVKYHPKEGDLVYDNYTFVLQDGTI